MNKQQYQCRRHPEVRLIPLGRAARGGFRFLCSRCSKLIMGGQGRITRLIPSRGLGEIRAEESGEALVFLLSEARDYRLRVGQQVHFEYGVLGGDGDGTYRRAATNLRLLAD